MCQFKNLQRTLVPLRRKLCKNSCTPLEVRCSSRSDVRWHKGLPPLQSTDRSYMAEDFIVADPENPRDKSCVRGHGEAA